MPIENYDPGFKTRFTPNLGLCMEQFNCRLDNIILVPTPDTLVELCMVYLRMIRMLNQLGVNYSEKTYRERTPPKYTLSAECGTIRGTIVDVGVDSVQLDTVEVVTSVTKM